MFRACLAHALYCKCPNVETNRHARLPECGGPKILGVQVCQSGQRDPRQTCGAHSSSVDLASGVDLTSLPQKALRGVIPASLCPVLGAIFGEIVVKS